MRSATTMASGMSARSTNPEATGLRRPEESEPFPAPARARLAALPPRREERGEILNGLVGALQSESQEEPRQAADEHFALKDHGQQRCVGPHERFLAQDEISDGLSNQRRLAGFLDEEPLGGRRVAAELVKEPLAHAPEEHPSLGAPVDGIQLHGPQDAR